MRIRLNITSWGRFIDPLLDTLIPSLLAPGNLPALASRHQCSIDLCTTVNLFEELAEHPLIGKLVEYADITLVPVDHIFHRKPHVVLTHAHRHTLKAALNEGAACMFIQPDMLFADNGLRWLSEAACDATAILIATPRAIIGNVTSISERYRENDIITIQPRELIRLALDHRHPVTDSLIVNGTKASSWPSQLYWQVGNEGLIVRGFHLHPIFLVPNESALNDTIDGDYLDSNEGIVYVTDSDDMAVIELSQPGHMHRTIINSPMWSGLVKAWADEHPTAIHKKHAGVSLRLKADFTDAQAWDAMDKRAGEFYGQVVSKIAAAGVEPAKARL